MEVFTYSDETNSFDSGDKNKLSFKQYLKNYISLYVSSIIIALLALLFIIFTINNAYIIKNGSLQIYENEPGANEESFNLLVKQLYPEETKINHPLPYSVAHPDLDISAESAVLVDYTTGNILYEKNSETKIPPASMTKLVEMYVVLDEVEKGKFTLDDIVPLPEESWAQNLPKDASIMFLNQGQKVTLRELLLGLSIASGNDASIAVAKYIAGSMEAFVEKMNAVCKSLGLENTHFVESSGYSEENITTAKEFAQFCTEYIRCFPFTLKEFHSQKILEYPKKENLADWHKTSETEHPILQYNTNKLLGVLEGCDGLKTGFIYESGYNISLTAKRDERRFISVTMKGPGNNSKEGNYYRIKDGTNLMEYAFSNFVDYKKNNFTRLKLPVLASSNKNISVRAAYNESFSVPKILLNEKKNLSEMVEVKIVAPKFIFGKINEGEKVGNVLYIVNGKVLNTVPLLSQNDCAPASMIIQKLYRLSLWCLGFNHI